MTTRRTGTVSRSGSGFTLIELLVVIAIIALLVTILMPSLNSAKELARRAVCASTVRNWGLVAHTFANENDGNLPGANSREWWWLPAMPDRVRLGETGREGASPGYPITARIGSGNQTFREFEETRRGRLAYCDYGSSIDTLEKYGLAHGMFDCPSREADIVYYTSNGFGVSTMDYMYVGSFVPSPGREYEYAFTDEGLGIPAPAQDSSSPAECLLAGDVVKYDKYWGGGFSINHPSREDSLRLGYQNLLRADASVYALDEGDYPDPLDAGNCTMDPYNSYRYWWSSR